MSTSTCVCVCMPLRANLHQIPNIHRNSFHHRSLNAPFMFDYRLFLFLLLYCRYCWPFFLYYQFLFPLFLRLFSVFSISFKRAKFLKSIRFSADTDTYICCWWFGGVVVVVFVCRWFSLNRNLSNSHMFRGCTKDESKTAKGVQYQAVVSCHLDAFIIKI